MLVRLMFCAGLLGTSWAQLTCAPGEEVTSAADEVQCGDDFGCDGCIFTLTDSELLDCGGKNSCDGIEADITAKEDFFLTCGNEFSCAGDGACSNTIVINCDGVSIKGIKCGGANSCENQNFVIDGGANGCTVEKVECDGADGCSGATFEFINAVITDGFICGAGLTGSCDGIACEGSSDCPSNSVALPDCSITTTVAATTSTAQPVPTTTDALDATTTGAVGSSTTGAVGSTVTGALGSTTTGALGSTTTATPDSTTTTETESTDNLSTDTMTSSSTESASDDDSDDVDSDDDDESDDESGDDESDDDSDENFAPNMDLISATEDTQEEEGGVNGFTSSAYSPRFRFMLVALPIVAMVWCVL